MPEHNSVSQWIEAAKAGEETAVHQLWDRYFQRLAGLARKKLEGLPRLPADGDDVALSAFHSLCRGLELGKFPDLADRDSLWRLLVTIAARKSQHLIRDEHRDKRGGGKTTGQDDALLHVIDREPTPEFAAEVADECQNLLAQLDNDEMRAIALARMDGYCTEEIAKRMGKSLSFIERKLRLIRAIWSQSAG
jgi:DNA-directed RNA polymerase specialized sigma24 family protein